MENVTLKIEGMSCGGCTSSVTNVLQAIEGVNQVEVTLDPGQAVISFDSAKTNLSTLQDAIEGAGFDVVA
jgi:copper chaperone